MQHATNTLADLVERCYRKQDFDGLADIYDPDVVLDVHLPQWRFQLQGPDALIGWIKEQVGQFTDFRVVWTRATPTSDGAVIEWEMRHGTGDREQLCRQVDILHGADGKVTEHVIWCTGMWDPPTIARQKAEAPMVRW